MLSEQQRKEFLLQGFILPGAEANVTGQLPAQGTIERLLAAPGSARDPAVDRHLDDPLTYKLCTAPAIIERVAALLGPNLLLWHSRYFDKPAAGPPIPWHQDAPFWTMEPKRCVSAWLALELSRGEFFLFDCWLLHRSGSNTGGESRLALSMQFIPPEVKIGLEKRRAQNPDFGVQLVRGCDRLHLNPLAAAPVS